MSGVLDAPLGAVAFCWRIARRDGVTMGFTSHDRDLEIDGLPYRAAPGMLPSAIEKSDGLDPDAVEVTGALTAEAISAGDLAAGRWDGAAVRLFATDWTAPGEALVLLRGTFGAVEQARGTFSVALNGPTALLDAPASEATSPTCRAELGDRRCRVALRGRRQMARVTAADGATVTLDSAEPAANGWGNGLLRWIDGANGGTSAAVLASSGAVVTLAEPPAFAAAAGTRVVMTEGCDKRLATCAGRFANAINFRGEPFLPGNDLLTRYPGE